MQLDVEALEVHANSFSQLCHRLERSLPPNALVQELRQDAVLWKGVGTLLNALRTEGMKDRHWDAVQEVLGGPLPRHESRPPLTLVSVLTVQVR
jgi:hypothetical protein